MRENNFLKHSQILLDILKNDNSPFDIWMKMSTTKDFT